MNFKSKANFISILFIIGTVFGENIDPRQTAIFSSSNTYTIDGPEKHQPSITVFDTLSGSSNKQSVNSGGSAQQSSFAQGKQLSGGVGPSYSFSSASADAGSSYSTLYESPGNKQTGGYSSYNPVVSTQKPVYNDYKPQQSQQPNYGQQKPEDSYAYYYQHYPSQSYGQGQSMGGHHQGHGLLPSGDSGHDFLGGFGDFGGIGAGGGALGLGGLGAVGLAALAKGALALKPLLIFGLLFLLALPLLILFLPIPIVTINRPQSRSSTSLGRQLMSSAYATLSDKVLSSEECLERIVCKAPVYAIPEKYQSKAKALWDEYGTKFIQNGRIRRGLDGYFKTPQEAKQKIFKCNQQFKCSNKFL